MNMKLNQNLYIQKEIKGAKDEINTEVIKFSHKGSDSKCFQFCVSNGLYYNYSTETYLC
jgi:hypothetical protein